MVETPLFPCDSISLVLVYYVVNSPLCLYNAPLITQPAGDLSDSSRRCEYWPPDTHGNEISHDPQTSRLSLCGPGGAGAAEAGPGPQRHQSPPGRGVDPG